MPFVFGNPNYHGSGFIFDDPTATAAGGDIAQTGDIPPPSSGSTSTGGLNADTGLIVSTLSVPISKPIDASL